MLRALYFLKIEHLVPRANEPTNKSTLAVSQNFTFNDTHFILSVLNVNVTNDLLTAVRN